MFDDVPAFGDFGIEFRQQCLGFRSWTRRAAPVPWPIRGWLWRFSQAVVIRSRTSSRTKTNRNPMPSTSRRVSISFAKTANIPIIRAITISPLISCVDRLAGGLGPDVVVETETLEHQRREGHRDVEHPVDRLPVVAVLDAHAEPDPHQVPHFPAEPECGPHQQRVGQLERLDAEGFVAADGHGFETGNGAGPDGANPEIRLAAIAEIASRDRVCLAKLSCRP